MTAQALSHPAGHAVEHGSHDPVSNTTFGFWLYIMTDCVLFASVFATFVVMSHSYAGGPTGKELFNLPYVFGETMCLLFSSVTYGFAMLAMLRNEPSKVVTWLGITFLLGLGFIGMEVNEFAHMIMEGNGPERSGYLSSFFTLVGTHGTHVTFGLIWIAVMMAQVMGKGLTTPVRSRLVRLSMFWHFLDIVWIGVFTVVYLMGVMQ
ncbi:MAG TPA: cytochrome o ubiquinol oxidase subunit III [Parasulfuritortus sp.]